MSFSVACVGAGYFSQFHYESWTRIPGADLVAACDLDLEKARATGLLAFDELVAMVSETSPDVLDIILPPVAQAEAIRTALANGVKWIICQKPFCQSLEEAREVVSEADAANAKIIVHENFRFQPWYRTMKTAIEAGVIGDVLQATFRLRPGDGQGAEAYLDRQPYFQKMPRLLIHETGVHFVDTFRYLLGNVEAVYADLRRVNPVIAGEDAGIVIFDHAGGVRAIFDGNRCADHAADNMRRTMGEALIEGTEGCLTLTGDGAVMQRRFATMNETCLLPPDTHDGFGGDCVHHLQCHVASAVMDSTDLENEAAEYLAVIEAEIAIYKSAETGTKIRL